MANRALRSLEKAFVVRAIHRAEKARKHLEMIATIRKDLADVFGCSLARVSGTGAEGRKIRPERMRVQGMKESDVELIRGYIGLASSDQQRALLEQELCEIFPAVPLAFIRFVTSGTRSGLDALLASPDGEKLRILVPQSILDAAYSSVAFLHGDMGAHTDYKTRNKIEWRTVALKDSIADFLPNHESRQRKNVLCIPAKECLEIDEVFLPLQFSPSRITAVEGGDPLARGEFVINARERGVDFKLERLEDFLPRHKARFDVVSLDFAGQLCPLFHQIASQLLLSDRSLVIFNTMARRESGKIQGQLEWLQEQMVAEAQREQEVDAIYRARYEEMPSPSTLNQQWSLEVARELSSLLLVTGMQRRENWSFAGRIARLPLLEQVRSLSLPYERSRIQANLQIPLEPMIREIVTLLGKAKLIDMGNIDEVKGIISLDRMFFDVIFGSHYITQLRKFTYESETSEGRLDYYTDVAVIHRPNGLYQDRDVSNATEFLLYCADDAIRILHNNPEPEPLTHYRFAIARGGHLLGPEDAAKRSDLLVCLRDGKLVRGGKIPMHALLNAAAKTQEFRSREGNYGNLRTLLAAPRIRISPQG